MTQQNEKQFDESTAFFRSTVFFYVSVLEDIAVGQPYIRTTPTRTRGTAQRLFFPYVDPRFVSSWGWLSVK